MTPTKKQSIRRAKLRMLRAVDEAGQEHALVDVLYAARALNSSHDFVSTAAQGGLIRVVRPVSGGPLLYSRADVEAFRQWLQAAAAAPTAIREPGAPWVGGPPEPAAKG